MDMISNHHLDSMPLHPPGKTSLKGEMVIAMNFPESGAQALLALPTN